MARRLWHWREPAAGAGFGYSAGHYPFEKRYQALARGIELNPMDSMPFPDVDANGLDLFPRYYLTTGDFQVLDVVAYTPTADGATWGNDQQARTFIETSSSTTSAAGVAARLSGTAAGAENFYGADITGDTGQLELYKYVAGVYTSLGTSAKTISASPEGWNIKIDCEGTSIKAKAWRWDAKEPTAWDITAVDASIASGAVGLISYILGAPGPALGKPRFLSSDDAAEDRDAPRPKTNAEIAAFAAGKRGADSPMFLLHVGVLGYYDGGFLGDIAIDSTLCLSTAPFTSSATDDPANATYHDVIIEMPVLKSDATEIFTGQSRQDYGSFTIALGAGERDHWLGWNFDGKDVEAWVGGIGWDRWDFLKVMTGIVAGIETPDPDRMVFNVRDKSAALARTFQDNTISGSGPNAGRPAPYALGYLFNIEPILEDAAALQYRFDDGTHNDAVITVPDVRDSGVTVTFTEETDADSGTFTLSASPTGRITCDVVVTTADSHPEMFFEVASVGDLDYYRGDGIGSEANWADAAQAGIFIPSSSEPTTGQVLDQIAQSGSAFWWFDRLQFLRAAKFDGDDPYHHHELSQDEVANFRMQRYILPSLQEPVYAKKNWTVQADGLAGAVSATDRATYAAPGIPCYPDAILGTPPLNDARRHELVRSPKFRETLYYAAADAETEAERLRDIFWYPTAIFSLEVRSWAPRFGIGEMIKLTHERFGFSAGKTALIVGIEEDMNRGIVRLSVFTTIDASFPEVSESYAVVPTSEVY